MNAPGAGTSAASVPDLKFKTFIPEDRLWEPVSGHIA